MSCKADIAAEAEFRSALQWNPIHFITIRIKYVLLKGFSKLKYALKRFFPNTFTAFPITSLSKSQINKSLILILPDICGISNREQDNIHIFIAVKFAFREIKKVLATKLLVSDMLGAGRRLDTMWK